MSYTKQYQKQLPVYPSLLDEGHCFWFLLGTSSFVSTVVGICFKSGSVEHELPRGALSLRAGCRLVRSLFELWQGTQGFVKMGGCLLAFFRATFFKFPVQQPPSAADAKPRIRIATVSKERISAVRVKLVICACVPRARSR